MRAINSGVDALRQAAPHSRLFGFAAKWQNNTMLRSDLNMRADGLTNAWWESVRESLVASRIQEAQRGNKRRRASPQYQLAGRVKIHSSIFSRESHFHKLEPMLLGPYPVINCFPDSDNYTIKTLLAVSEEITVHTFLVPY